MNTRSFGILLALVALSLSPAPAQEQSVASRVYKQASGSVVLLIVRDTSGKDVALGSGFVIQGGRIVTNEHVVRPGAVFVDLGAVKLPAKVELLDSTNDLAILSTSVELSVNALPLSTKPVTPGMAIYALGNPEGLEKTISNGVVSGVRQLSGRELIQISSPISHGSSGGPILNGEAEVVGVAVGALESGQNLNFAVPVNSLTRLLSGSEARSDTFRSNMDRVAPLVKKRAEFTWSAEDNSDWQKADREIDNALVDALNRATTLEQFMEVAKEALNQNTDILVSASERAVKLKPTPEGNRLLGIGLRTKAIWADDKEKAGLLERAEGLLRAAIQATKSPDYELVYAFADVLEDRGKATESNAQFKRALDLAKSSGAKDDQANGLRALARTSYALNQAAQGDAFFKELVSLGSATAWDWSQQGERQDRVGNYRGAGTSYLEAAKLGGDWNNWCEAAGSLIAVSGEDDTVLASARRCISEGAGKKDSEQRLAVAHYRIAIVLNSRGVYQEALTHAREAITLVSNYAWAYNAQAEALQGLRRFQEAINASNQAIRLSDGKYSAMHFTLGSSYYELENWEFALNSYKQAASMDKTDDAAAYNVALCFTRLGYKGDAVQWFEEVLRRNPNHPKKQDILSRIQNLKR